MGPGIHTRDEASIKRHAKGIEKRASDTDVALVIESLESGGAQRVVTILANAWAQRGIRVTVVTMAARDTDFYTLDSLVARQTIGRAGRAVGLVGRVSANLRQMLALRHTLRTLQPYAVVSFIMQTNVLTIIATTGLPCHVVVSERNDPLRQLYSKHWRLLRRLLYRRAHVITANSHSAIETMRAYVPRSKLAYVPNPLLVRPIPCTRRAPDKAAPFILAVGRLHEQKGHDVLLPAFARFVGRSAGWRLRILGDGPLRGDLQVQATELGVDGQVDWQGVVADPFPHYETATIFALPSRYEGIPNALLEAMNCGLAVVVSNGSPGPLEFVSDEVTGLVVPVGDVEALTAALDRLARDDALRRRLGEAARARVAGLASDKVLLDWERVIGLTAHMRSQRLA